MQTERFHCLNCDWFGDEPVERVEEERYEGAIRELVTLSCPACRTESLDEVFACEECGERPAEIEDWCKECHQSLADRGLLIDLG